MTRSSQAFRPRALQVLLVWVLLELAAAAQVRTGHEILLVSWLRTAVSPVVMTAQAAVRSADDLLWGLRDFRRLSVENGRLRRTVATTQARLHLLAAELEQHRMASRIVSSFPRLDLSSSVATCIRRSLGDGRLAIDAGAPRGVRRNMPVIADAGLVGRVVRVGRRWSWIETISRSGAAVAVAGGPDRTPCLAVGTGGRTLRVEYVPRRAPMVQGVELLTTGVDGLYPAGIPVAKVVRVREGPGAFLVVEAVPAVDLARLQVVVLVGGWSGAPDGAATP
ncbi:MAG: rod shape-determining protein MreC [Acidobacteria bacterium]|nr:rod shape-determining protein MreC [Acidobacteriota bacterium]